MTEYREIERFPGYRFGDDGTFLSLGKTAGGKNPTCKQRRGTDHLGYVRLGMSTPRGKESHLLHDLILEAFVGPKRRGQIGLHFPDPDRRNNRLDNLRWGTHADNVADMVKHGNAKL